MTPRENRHGRREHGTMHGDGGRHQPHDGENPRGYRPQRDRGAMGLVVPLRPEREEGRFHVPDEEKFFSPFDAKQFFRLLSYLKPYRRHVFFALLLMLVAAATRLAVPYLLKMAIDQALDVHGGAAGLTAAERMRLINIYAGSFLLLTGAGLWATRWRIRLSAEIGQNALYDIRRHLFSHIQKLGFGFYDRLPVGKVLVRITNDVNALQDLLQNGLINTLTDVFLLLGIVVIMVRLHGGLALATFVVLPVLFLISTGLRKRIRVGWQMVRQKIANINAHLNESIQGMRVTQAFVQEDENMEFFEGMNYDNFRSWMRAIKTSALFWPMVEITGAVGTAIVFWYGANLLREGAISVGDVVAFLNYVGQFWEPMLRLGQVYTMMLAAMASSERIFEFLDSRPDVASGEGAGEMTPIEGHVRFDGVTFAYEEGRPVLHNIDFEVPAGQTVALVGHTGSGKTTIVSLLSRFYDVDEGRVLIDGVDVRDVTLDSLRSQLAVVLQDTFLFQGTVKDNIRYGRLDATDEEVEAAARAVHAHTFIEAMEEGYDTEVRERGSRLSVGQRQLLSFARALLADPRILILDEATSSIDTQTEVLVQKALARLLEGRTAFIIAHRLSTIRHADQIIVLDHGRIVERGTHYELYSRRGVYYNLIQAQYRFLA